MGGIFNALVGAGNALRYGQEYELGQADLEQKQQQVAMSKLAATQQQQQMENQKGMGQYIKSQIDADQSIVSDPMKTAQMYEKTAGMAMAGGDFQSAQMMSELANGKRNDALKAAQQLAQQTQLKKETLASSASDYQQNPTPEGAAAMVQNAVAAGVPPSSIPAPGTPAFKGWVTSQSQAAMNAKERADFVEKQAEFKQKHEETVQAHKDSEEDKRQQRQQTALMRESMAEDRRTRLELEKQRIAQPSKTQEAATNAIVGSASEAFRGLRVIGQMAAGQSAGAFSGLHNGTIPAALAKTGTNMVTPQSMQMYQTASAGLGLELGRVLTLGGGRGVNAAQIKEFQDMTQVHPGDTELEAMFKYSNAADIVRNRLSTLPDAANPKVAAQQKEVADMLDKIPTPEQVMDIAAKHGQQEKLLSKYGNMAQAATAIQSGSIGNAPAPSGSPALPSGWSVKEH